MPIHRKSKWGDWSEWTWEADRQFYYRVRQDINGSLDYSYSYGQTTSPGKDSAYASNPTSPQEPFPWQNVHADQDEADLDKKRREDERRRQKNQKKFRRPEDAKPQKYKPGDADSSVQDDGVQAAHQFYASHASASHGIEERDAYQFYIGSSGAHEPLDPSPVAGQSDNASGVRNRAWEHSNSDDDDYQLNIISDPSNQADSYPTSAYQPGRSAASSYLYEDLSNPHSAEPSIDDPGTEPTTSDESGTFYGLDDYEVVDPRYKVERSDRFQPGEIFKVNWAEKRGKSQQYVVASKTFIVVANDQGHSTCLPISTYGGKACTDHDKSAYKHGIVYSRGSKPKLLDGEPALGFAPIKVDITQEGERLRRESRVNYSKLVVVDHTCRVMMIGTVVKTDWPTLVNAVERCWDTKQHHKRKRHASRR